jgi:hypothetical protein
LAGEDDMTRTPGNATAIVVTLLSLATSASTAFAEDCRALPPGPDRRACAMREHPGRVEAKQEHCKELASERGFTEGAGSKHPGGMRDFVQACMRGRQQ